MEIVKELPYHLLNISHVGWQQPNTKKKGNAALLGFIVRNEGYPKRTALK